MLERKSHRITAESSFGFVNIRDGSSCNFTIIIIKFLFYFEVVYSRCDEVNGSFQFTQSFQPQ